MLLQNVRIENYKAFLDSDVINFRPGINLFVGQNNAGKSSALDILSTRFSNRPNLSTKTVPQKGDSPYPMSKATYLFSFRKEELRKFLFNYTGPVFFPGQKHQDMADPTWSVNQFLSDSRPFEDRFVVSGNGGYGTTFDIQTMGYSFGLFHEPGYKDVQAPGFEFSERDDNRIDMFGAPRFPRKHIHESLKIKFFEHMKSSIFRFDAERRIPALSRVGASTDLKSDASNLGEVLDNLQGNHEAFDEYNKLVSEVFPQIKRVSVVKVISNDIAMNQILLWPHDFQSKRIDLAIPLSQSGTGVGQALAILYVLLSSEGGKVLLIDEPQSFLHPGAVKKLISIIRRHPEHQVFITTHSADVILQSEASTITRFDFDGESIGVKSIDSGDRTQTVGILKDMGVSLSDVFGADSVLWVEGPTEETVFPLILKRFNHHLNAGIVIKTLKATGEITSKKTRDTILHVYKKLTESTVLIPPAIAFLLDSEDLDKAEKERMMAANPKLKFLPRVMYENYLLNAGALFQLVQSRVEFLHKPTLEDVQGWLREQREGGKFLIQARPSDYTSSQWQVYCHGAKVLEAFFAHFGAMGGGFVKFEKTTHSVDLTRYCLEEADSDLPEVYSFLKAVLPEH